MSKVEKKKEAQRGYEEDGGRWVVNTMKSDMSYLRKVEMQKIFGDDDEDDGNDDSLEEEVPEMSLEEEEKEKVLDMLPDIGMQKIVYVSSNYGGGQEGLNEC